MWCARNRQAVRKNTQSSPGSYSTLLRTVRTAVLDPHHSFMERDDPSQGDHDSQTIAPKILYFGTPVVIVSSANEDGTTNLAPLSSFWALGWTVVLGLLRDTKTLQNLERRPDCVVNLPRTTRGRKSSVSRR